MRRNSLKFLNICILTNENVITKYVYILLAIKVMQMHFKNYKVEIWNFKEKSENEISVSFNHLFLCYNKKKAEQKV